MRKCQYCGLKKNNDGFYAYNDKECKKCLNARTREWHKRNPHKEKEYREKHKERQRIYYRKWYAEKGRNRSATYEECIKSWGKANPEAVRVRKIIANEIRRGRLQRPATCDKCGRDCSPHAHHNDYTKPLKIQWLCASCHKLLHNNVEKNA